LQYQVRRNAYANVLFFPHSILIPVRIEHIQRKDYQQKMKRKPSQEALIHESSSHTDHLVIHEKPSIEPPPPYMVTIRSSSDPIRIQQQKPESENGMQSKAFFLIEIDPHHSSFRYFFQSSRTTRNTSYFCSYMVTSTN
jgi:hypothetical protein